MFETKGTNLVDLLTALCFKVSSVVHDLSGSVSSVLWHGAAYIVLCVYLYDTCVKYGTAKKYH
jgi:hypothetical protein